MAKTMKPIPVFNTEDEEHEFWATHDSADYLDWRRASSPTLPHLKPSLKTISLRLPEWMIADLKALANERDIPYQSLLKMFLADRLKQELGKAEARKASLTSQ